MAAPITSSSLDLNSLIHGDVSTIRWRSITPSGAPKVVPNLGIPAGGGAPIWAVLINADLNAPGNGVLEYALGVPDGVLAGRFDVPMIKASGGTIYAEVRTYPANTLLGSFAQAPTTSFVTYSVGPVTVTPKTDVILRIYTNGGGSSAQASAYVGRVAFVPTTITAPFTSDSFARVDVDPTSLWDNGICTWINGRTYWRTPFARFILETDAPYIFTQSYNGACASSGIAGGISTNSLFVQADGQLVALTGLTQGTAPREDYVRVPLPGKRGRESSVVEIIGSAGFESGISGLPSGWIENSLNSVLVPSGYACRIIQPSRDIRKTVFYGDSIMLGFNSTQLQNGIIFQLRQRLVGTVACEALSAGSLFRDTANGGSAQLLANRLAAHNADVYWLQIGTNDYGLTLCSAATFGTLYASVLDKLHALVPRAIIYCQTPLVRGTETANAFGDTTDAYRAQIETAAAARTFCRTVNGKVIVPVANLAADGLHLSDVGSVLWAHTTCNILDANDIRPDMMGTLACWYIATHGLTFATGVSQWNDQSGNARNLTQGTGSAQPTQLLREQNGYPALQFVAGSSQVLSLASTNLFGTAAYTMWAVLKYDSVASNMIAFGNSSASGGTAFATPSGNRSATHVTVGDNADGVASTSAYEIWIARFVPGTGTFVYINGNIQVLTPVGGQTTLADAGGTARIAVGAFWSGSFANFWSGRMLECGAYASDIGAVNAITLSRLLGAKYGIVTA